MQDSWLWQMHADIPLEDQTHETFWRRLLRWLVDGVPERLEVAVDHERVERGDPVQVTATLRDDRVHRRQRRDRAAPRSPPPTVRTTEMPLAFVVDRDGEYRATFAAAQDGLYEVAVDAGPTTGAGAGVRAGGARRPRVLRRGDAAGLPAPRGRRHGRPFLHAGDASTLPEDITYLGRGVTVVQEKDLWDMPVVLVLLVGLAGGEWVLRRRWGLA